MRCSFSSLEYLEVTAKPTEHVLISFASSCGARSRRSCRKGGDEDGGAGVAAGTNRSTQAQPKESKAGKETFVSFLFYLLLTLVSIFKNRHPLDLIIAI